MQLALWEDPAPLHRTAGVRRPSRARAPATAPKALGMGADGLEALADRYVEQAHADRTRAAYRADWAAFATWCEARTETALPATSRTLELYLTHLAACGKKASTIRRARIAIGLAHGHAGEPRPDQHARIRALERGIGRVHGTHEEGAAPLLAEDVMKLALALGKSARDERDRALILVGFAGAFRPSELVGLDINAVKFTADGVELFVARSKEDQLGEGAVVRIAKSQNVRTCPVVALRVWIRRVGRPAGPLFRHVRGNVIEHERLHPRAVFRAVQYAAALAGVVGDYSGHSLRSGLATSAYAAGSDERSIQQHGRWKDRRSLDRYIHTERLPPRDSVSRGLL